jgi:hypothetical protein
MFPYPITARSFLFSVLNGQLGAESGFLLLDAETARLPFWIGKI